MLLLPFLSLPDLPGVLRHAIVTFATPLLLGYVLGPLLEENLRRALLISRGDPTVFFTRPVSGVVMAVAILTLVYPVIRQIRRKVS